MDKIKLITNDYNNKLKNFAPEVIDKALAFLERRRQNNEKSNNDLELDIKTKEIFALMEEYAQELKKYFVDNNIYLTHISSISPDKLEKGVLKKSIDKANIYETERVDGVFASSYPLKDNPYIARNSSGMIMLAPSVYIYGNDNIEVISDLDEKKQAILKQPNYIYYLNPVKFKPVCTLMKTNESNEPIFVFSEEWISDSEINVFDSSQVKKIEEISDVTNLLEHYLILCDKESQEIGIMAKTFKNRNEAIKFIEMKINDGSIRYINGEINDNKSDEKKR